jgi:apoptosis-inducing factor 3
MDLSQLPDFRGGMEIRDILDGTIVAGRVDAVEAILVRRGEEFFAVSGQCTRYHGALARGLAVGDTIRYPLHHACFSLRSGLAAADRLRREGYAGRITMLRTAAQFA